MKEYAGIESKLFEWVECEDANANYSVYSDITLKRKIGKFPKGTKFTSAEINYDDAELTFEDENGELYRFKCFLSVDFASNILT